MLVHNESSTAVTNDLKSIADVVKREFGKLLIVDAVSSVGSISLETDAWGCDLVATASQKGLLLPPGLSFISVSPAAWQAYKSARMPKYYFDLGLAKSFYERGQTPFTPGLPLFYALDVALDRLLAEGLEAVYTRHAVLARRARQGLRDLGLSLLADDSCASNTVTAAKIPEGVNFKSLQETLRKDYKVVIADGLGKLNGKVFRVGHMGAANETEIDDCIRAIGAALSGAGFRTRA
jgi:aspartate aminotransferase-like enzyme